MRSFVMISALCSASALGVVASAAELQRGRLMRAPTHDGDGPAWFYGPDNQSGVFQPGANVPAGWHDHPSKVKGAEPAGGGVHTARTSANGPVSEAKVAKSTTSQSDTIVDPAIAATKGVGGLGSTPATGDTASKTTSTTDAKPDIDSDGHPFDPALHAATKSKTKDGKWRMKVGVKRPAPAPGYPLDL